MNPVQKVWVVLHDEPDGTEGVAAFHSPEHGGWMPLVCTVEKNLPALRLRAQQIAEGSGETLQLVEFSTRDVKALIRPQKREASS